MRLITRPSIQEQIMAAIQKAKRNNQKIEGIVLTAAEFDELKASISPRFQFRTVPIVSDEAAAAYWNGYPITIEEDMGF